MVKFDFAMYSTYAN